MNASNQKQPQMIFIQPGRTPGKSVDLFKKHPQFVLAVLDQLLQYQQFKQGMNCVYVDQDLGGVSWFETAQSHLVLRERAYLDDPKIVDANYRQILPYVIVRLHDPDGFTTRYVTYQRTKLVGEERLAGNVSIGFGGHVDMADVVLKESVPQLRETVVQCAYRELIEELEILLAQIPFTADEIRGMKFSSIGEQFIYDNTNDVGKVHLGLVVALDIHDANLRFRCREEELEMMEPMTAEELLNSDFPLENWTRIYLESQLNWEETKNV